MNFLVILSRFIRTWKRYLENSFLDKIPRKFSARGFLICCNPHFGLVSGSKPHSHRVQATETVSVLKQKKDAFLLIKTVTELMKRMLGVNLKNVRGALWEHYF